MLDFYVVKHITDYLKLCVNCDKYDIYSPKNVCFSCNKYFCKNCSFKLYYANCNHYETVCKHYFCKICN